jgi:hypothetical protein
MLDGVALLYDVWNFKPNLFIEIISPETNTSHIKSSKIGNN